jgi:hypothetical protein
MKLLVKLQRKTLILSQIIGYGLTLFIGTVIIISTIQLFIDTQNLLKSETDVFKANTLVISKNVSIFKTIDKKKIYFSSEELEDLRNQDFASGVSIFNNANFKVNAYNDKAENLPVYYTDLFFESIPDKYLDVHSDEWVWDSSESFIPIIIPESYVKLYNFGFAESQGLPVFSNSTISELEFNIEISGNRLKQHFRSKIVGFSNKVNSILVPEIFLKWANNKFGRENKKNTSRILLELSEPSSDKLLNYINEHNLSVNQDELNSNKLIYIFKYLLYFIITIAMIIVFLSVSSIILSFYNVIQKNKEVVLSLHNIGYNHFKISLFYQILISTITVFIIVASIMASNYLRDIYLNKFDYLFNEITSFNFVVLIGLVLIFSQILLYNYLIYRKIKNIIKY